MSPLECLSVSFDEEAAEDNERNTDCILFPFGIGGYEEPQGFADSDGFSESATWQKPQPCLTFAW